MRVAVVHDWLLVHGGAERVLEEILRVLPAAELFSLVDFLPDDARGFLGGRRARTSFIQRLPAARTRYRSYLPLMPLAVEGLDVSAFDLVVSSSYAVAKGVLTGPDQLHLCFCHSPIRYAWDMQEEYLRQTGLDRGARGAVARYLLHRIRHWDVQSANRVDAYAAVSRFVARRIQKYYRRDAVVIHSPVDVTSLPYDDGPRDDFYLTASRLVPYKRVDMIVEAFRRLPDRRLVVVGDGPELARVRAAAGPNVEVRGHVPVAELRRLQSRARAFLFAAVEDFGIAPLEALACGTPVVALARGGALETVPGLDADEPCGVLYDQQTPAALAAAVHEFEREAHRIDPAACRRNAERFSAERFRDEFGQWVAGEWAAFSALRGSAVSGAPAGVPPAFSAR